MKAFTLDVETTISNKGSPFDLTNKLVVVGFQDTQTKDCFLFYSEQFDECWKFIVTNWPFRIVAFNTKFDLHWLRREKLLPEDLTDVWCCQLWEFFNSNMREVFPSLEGVVSRRYNEHKLDVVKTEYWEKGIDTDQVPRDILSEYLIQDLNLETKLYLDQLEEHKDWFKLFRVHCADLLVLEEMEWNGLLLDTEACHERYKECIDRIQEIEYTLRQGYESYPINFDSTDHVSAYLYGGKIIKEDRVPIGVYKTGIKAGLPRNKIVTYEYDLPRMVEPLKGSELKKEGLYGTSEDVLRRLKLNKTTKRIIELILERSGLQKLANTYYGGFPKIIKEGNWKEHRVCGQYNQVVAATGRLSSSKPNLQNIPPELKELLVSRYE